MRGRQSCIHQSSGRSRAENRCGADYWGFWGWGNGLSGIRSTQGQSFEMSSLSSCGKQDGAGIIRVAGSDMEKELLAGEPRIQ